PSPLGIKKKSTDWGSVVCRIEQRILTLLHLIASEKRPPAAPPAARDPAPSPPHDVIGAVGDEPFVRTEDVAQATLDLRRRVVSDAQAAGRLLDELLEHSYVRQRRKAHVMHGVFRVS